MSKSICTDRRIPLSLMGLALGLILAAALSYFIDNPSLIQHTEFNAQPRRQDTSLQGPVSDNVTNFIKRLEESPSDTGALMAMAQHFLHTGELDKAETFALRAVLSAPDDPVTLYTLGLIQHNAGRHGEAAVSLEKSLAIRFDPFVGYSLGILYAWYMDAPDKGISQLRAVLDSGQCPAELENTVRNDIQKIEAHKNH